MLAVNHSYQQSCKWLLLIVFFASYLSCAAQSRNNKKHDKSGRFYLAAGTNWSFFSRSDIHLRSAVPPTFDFTLYNVRGKDDGGVNFHNGAPQYSYVLGYYSHIKNWGIEYNFDHIKYYMEQNQRVRMQGVIHSEHYNTDTLLVPSFVTLEHTDGANYALLKLVKWIPLFYSNGQIPTLHLILKGGTGPVIPKTNSTILGKHRDDRYKIAGYVIALEGGLRYSFSKFLFAEGGVKGAYADYSNFLIADGKGSQRWTAIHFHLLVGAQLENK